jgi:peptidyl-prolyl cis-trans isomerase SurA
VQVRFGPRAQVSEDDVDRAVALAGQQGGARVLISEILLPARTPEEAAAAQARAEEFSRIRGFAAFAQTARDFSASQSRADGGRVNRWLTLGELPPPLRSQFLTMPIGGVTEPVQIPNAIGVFQLRAFEETSGSQAETVAIDYAEYLLPGGSAEDALRIAEGIDSCDDLYGVTQDLPEERLRRQSLPIEQIPDATRTVLATLDANEASVALSEGNTQILLMLCGRSTALSEGLDRGDVRRDLLNQRLSSYARGYLAELRADAVIVGLE